MTLNEYLNTKEYLFEDAVGAVNASGGPSGNMTTSANIAYIPGQLGVIKPILKKMSKKKTKWGVKVESYPKFKRLKIEEALSIDIKPEWFEYFKTDFTGGVTFPSSDFDVDLTAFLKESTEEELIVAKNSFKRALAAYLNSDPTKDYRFKISSLIADSRYKNWQISTIGKSLMVDVGVDAQFQKLVATVESAYGDDKGAYEILAHKLETGESLADVKLFSNYDNLVGTQLKGDFLGTPVLYISSIGLDFVPKETLQVGNKDIENKMKIATFMKFDNGKFYPTDEKGFPRDFTTQLKDLIEGK